MDQGSIDPKNQWISFWSLDLKTHCSDWSIDVSKEHRPGGLMNLLLIIGPHKLGLRPLWIGFPRTISLFWSPKFRNIPIYYPKQNDNDAMVTFFLFTIDKQEFVVIGLTRTKSIWFLTCLFKEARKYMEACPATPLRIRFGTRPCSMSSHAEGSGCFLA